MSFGKLVRDKIPEIIEAAGENPVTRQLGADEYEVELRRKLQEEVGEFIASGEPEELADIQEVVLALASVQGLTADQLEGLRAQKAAERGGFEQRIYLEGIQ